MSLKSVMLAVSCLGAATANAQESFTIQGKLDSLSEGMRAILMYTQENRLVRDSADISNGAFQFVGKLDNPVRARIAIYAAGQRASMENSRELYLENTNFEIRGTSLRHATIKGGKEQEGYVAYNALLKPYYDELEPYRSRISRYAKENKRDSVELMTAAIARVYEKIKIAEEAHIREYNDTDLALNLVNERTIVIDETVLGPLYNALSARLKESPLGKSIGERLAVATRPGSGVGTIAADFTQSDLNGNPITLASLRGRYVLIDFWASWCGPCRQENPGLKMTYSRFKDRNFEILGISLDSDKSLWQKAVAADGLPWIQVSDLKGMENEAAILYNVKLIPQNFLVNPDGYIIGKNLHGEELDKKLAEVL